MRKKDGKVLKIGLIVLVVVLMGMSFAIGMLLQKVQYLENGSTTTAAGQGNGAVAVAQGGQAQAAAPAGKYGNFQSALVDYAGQIGVDVNKFTTCLKNGGNTTAINADIKQGTDAGVNGTPTFYINGIAIDGAQPYAAFKQVIDTELAGKTDPKTPRTQIDIGNAPVRGSLNAKIKIVEFSDFQCPYCEAAVPTVNKVLSDYAGKVTLIYKQFPLSIHPNAMMASEASECALAQGKFWEMHDKLFGSQNEWANLPQT